MAYLEYETDQEVDVPSNDMPACSLVLSGLLLAWLAALE